MPKNVKTTVQFHSFYMPERSCSKFFNLDFSSPWTKNLQIYKLGLEKAEEPEIKSPTFTGSWKKQKNSRKTSISAFLTTLKPFTVWITKICGKFLKRWGYQITLPVSWETCMQVKKQQNQTWNNRLVQNWKSSMTRLYIVTLFIELTCRVHHVKCWAG